MRRLTYPEKFALLGGLLVLPLVVLLLLLLHEVQDATTITQQELAGNQYLRALRPLLEDLQHHRGLSNAVYSGALSLRSQQLEARRQIEKDMERLDELDETLNGVLDTGGRWTALKNQWSELGSRSSQLTTPQSVEQHTVLIAQILDLVRHVGSTSKLLLDPEVSSHNLMDLAVNRLPSLNEHIAQLRNWAGGAAARSRISTGDQFHFGDLNGLIGAELAAVRHSFAAALAEHPSLRLSLEPVLQQAITETRAYLRLLIERLMVTDPLATPADELWVEGTAASASTYYLFDATSVALDRILEARLARLRMKKIFVGSFTLSVLLAAVYLFIGFHRSVIDTIHKLAATARAMAAGRTDDSVSLPDSARDELQIATRALATLAARLQEEGRMAPARPAEAALASSPRLQTEEHLGDAQAAALEATRLVSKSLTNLSHAFRTPLNGILGMAELACEEAEAGEQRELVNTIRWEAESLLSVLNDVLDFSKIEVGEIALDTEPFCLRESLRYTLSLFSGRAQHKGVELVCDVEQNVPDALSGDVSRLRQIIVKLVENAIKFTNDGETVLRVALDSQTEEDVVLRFAVSDTGIGIPQDQHRSIFEPFAHARGSHARQHTGSGLGLTIASSLTAVMGGKMCVESTVGEGTTFHFSARFGLGSVDAPGVVAPDESALEGQRVLIVDDSAASRLALTAVLSSWRADVVAVENGPAARTAIQTALTDRAPFAVALVDVHMPDMDGFEVLRRIREDEDLCSTPVVLLASSDSRAHRELAETEGAVGCFKKPCVAIPELHDLLRQATSTAGAGASLTGEAARQRTAPPASIRILLAEDDEINRLVAGRLIERMGHTTVAVANGREALAALEQERFDLVLMDIQMPEMDGVEATETIRAREKATGAHLPIVALTALALTGDQERCLKAGMDGYLTKPVQEPELLAAIQRFVRCTRRPESHSPLESLASDVLDRETLRTNVGDDPGALLDLVTRFLGESQTILEELRHGITRGDAPALEQGARRLKGSLREVAATAARAAALRLEAVARVGDLAQAADLMFTLEDELCRLEPQLTSLRNDG